jgi:hypothetical protein
LGITWEYRGNIVGKSIGFLGEIRGKYGRNAPDEKKYKKN